LDIEVIINSDPARQEMQQGLFGAYDASAHAMQQHNQMV
jgi:hypothetical protein